MVSGWLDAFRAMRVILLIQAGEDAEGKLEECRMQNAEGGGFSRRNGQRIPKLGGLNDEAGAVTGGDRMPPLLEPAVGGRMHPVDFEPIVDFWVAANSGYKGAYSGYKLADDASNRADSGYKAADSASNRADSGYKPAD